jgi:hypothetical protein
MVMPVAGLMMGMAWRARVAAGWCSFRLDWLWNAGGMNGGDAELRENTGATVCGCWVGECAGELLANDERSEEALWMDTSCSQRSFRSVDCSPSTDAPWQVNLHRSPSTILGRIPSRPPGRRIGQPQTSCERRRPTATRPALSCSVRL